MIAAAVGCRRRTSVVVACGHAGQRLPVSLYEYLRGDHNDVKDRMEQNGAMVRSGLQSLGADVSSRLGYNI